MSSSQITIRPANAANDRSTVLRLLEGNLPEAANERRYDWAYLNNPDGIASVWLAETTDGEAIGTSAGFPRQFRINGDRVHALVLSDFAIDRRYRTLGPALALLRASLASIDEGSFEFALDHPSESMLSIYRRLGGSELGQQRRYVRPLKISGAAARRWGAGPISGIFGSIGDFALHAADRVRRVPGGMVVGTHSGDLTEEFARLGRELEKRRAICGDRSADYLNWRYQNGIRFSNSTVTVRSDRDLVAYAVLQQSEAATATIVEFVCRPDPAIETALFRATIEVARSANVESLQASCIEASAWCKLLEGLGFVAREQSTGPVVYVSKKSSLSAILTDKDNWWITDGDRDG